MSETLTLSPDVIGGGLPNNVTALGGEVLQLVEQVSIDYPEELAPAPRTVLQSLAEEALTAPDMAGNTGTKSATQTRTGITSTGNKNNPDHDENFSHDVNHDTD